MRPLRATTLLLAALALGACGPTKPPTNPNGVNPFRGLVVTPHQLAFTCVTPGCDATLTVTVSSTTTRRVAIKRIVLSDDTHPDFTVTPSQSAPFILGAASSFTIDVRYAPASSPDTTALALLVTYTDASATESPDRIEPGELNVPLVRRVVGEPLLEARPPLLSFGVVRVGASKTLAAEVRNDGFGNVAMDVDVADAGHPDVHVAFPSQRSLLPDAGLQLPISFTPTVEEYVRTEVGIGSTTPGAHPVTVTVEGTSHAWGRIGIEPEETGLDFGPVPKGAADGGSVTLRVANFGGQPLNISGIVISDAGVAQDGGAAASTITASLAGTTLQPLERVPLTVTLHPTAAGPLNETITFHSDDPVRPMLALPVTALVTQPQVHLTPGALAWGTVPMGWVLTRPIEIRNVGYGPLTLKHVTMVGGTSNLFTLSNVPQLPLKLERDQRVAVQVEFRAETNATFSGSVSVETDDPITPFAEVALSATGGSCAAGCPIANGTPDCTTGRCSVGTCDASWYDTNLDPSDGCECHEVGTEPDDFCGEALDKGILQDTQHPSTSATGILSSATDQDWIRFYGQDNFEFFSDSYDVRISLSTQDPTILMCVYHYSTSNHVNGCFLNNETCARSYDSGGGGIGNDGAEYYIKIYRAPNAGPTCTQYTVYMSNG